MSRLSTLVEGDEPERETTHELDGGRLTWGSWHEAAAVVADGQHLRRALVTAAVVGTALFAIDHLDVVLAGDATRRVWIKVAITYLVPFMVTLVGVLIGTHERDTYRRGPVAR